MNEEDLRKLFEEGFSQKLKPKIENMTNLMMDCYEQGFQDCWRILTKTEFGDGSNTN